MNVILFFTYGVSIKTWESTGILSREMELYNQLANKHNIKFTFVTYGDNDDYQFENYSQDYFIAGYVNVTGAIDEIEFKMSTGNFDGKIKMWGVK